MNTPTFPKLDPASPEFWDVRFAAHATPWDHGRVPACFLDFIATSKAPHRVLIPGCGSGYEVAALAARGWEVTAIDFSPAAVAAAKRVLGSLGHHVRVMDFFSDAMAKLNVDLIYERAFLCALPRHRWPQWAAQVAAVLPPGGLLAGFFYADESPKGPPFGLRAGELDELLAPAFVKLTETTPTDSIPIFRDKEKWMVWQRSA